MTRLRSHGQCFAPNCGKAFNSKIHDASHASFDHIYVGIATESMRQSRAKQPKLCASCAAGEHQGRKTEYGCIEIVAPEPKDYVCGCETCKLGAITSPKRSHGRSESSGVVTCRF